MLTFNWSSIKGKEFIHVERPQLGVCLLISDSVLKLQLVKCSAVHYIISLEGIDFEVGHHYCENSISQYDEFYEVDSQFN
jgi:hypothetical protein